MEYRRIIAEEFSEIADFAIEGMRADLYPMHLSRPKVVATVCHFARSRHDFHLAAFSERGVAGVIAAVVSEMPWFERCEAAVVMCRAVVPGVGRKLIAALRDWADNDPRIRRVQFPQEFYADPRALKLLARYGFKQQVVTCMYHKGFVPEAVALAA